MKLKEVNLSLYILTGLLFLSFSFFVAAQNNSSNEKNILLDSDQDGLADEEEKAYGTDPQNPDTDGDGYSDGVEVASGFNPLIAAPADRMKEEAPIVKGTETEPESGNLTEKMAKEISKATGDPDFNEEDVTVEDIQSMIDSALSSEDAQVKLPEISEDDLNIKKQIYGKLSEEEAKEREKADFLNYIIAVYYIMASNSPKPVTSASDITSITSGLSMKLIMAVSTRNTSSLKEVSASGEKMLEQMKEVEVPEKLTDLHIKGLSLAQYAATIKDDLAPKTNDPLGEIVNLSKIQNYMGVLAAYSVEVQQKFLEYDLSYTEEVKEKIKGFGLVAPDEEELSADALVGDDED